MQNSIDNFDNFTISTSVAMSNRCELFPMYPVLTEITSLSVITKLS